MDAVKRVFTELNYPSAERLLKALKSRGIPHDKQAVRKLVAAEATRQIQAPGPTYKGKIAAVNDVWFADLIDLSQLTNKKGAPRYILAVQDVFTRFLYVRAMTDKRANTTARAFEEILEEAGDNTPESVTSDKGAEFGSEFQQMLQKRGIEYKAKSSLREISTLDNAIRSFKTALARVMRKEQTDDWSSLLQRVVKGHNETPNQGKYLAGNSPMQAHEDEDLRERLEDKNDAYAAQNREAIERRAGKLDEKGYFRVLLNRPAAFKRAWQPNWSDKVHQIDYTYFDKVVDTEGAAYLTKNALPVERPSEELPRARAMEQKTRAAAVTSKNRQLLEPYANLVSAHFKGEVAIGQIGLHLRKRPGFQDALMAARINQRAPVANFLRLFPERFIVRPGGLRVQIRGSLLPGAQRLRRLIM